MVDTRWLEVSLRVTAEQAEAVAEVLGRYAPNGVVVEQPVTKNSRGEAVALENTCRVCAYLFLDESTETTRHNLEQSLWYLSRIQPLPAPEYRTVNDQDWMAAWKQHYQPVKIGSRLVIVPAWLSSEFPGRIAVRINPGMAFGTGAHPTTQLCLQALEDLVKPGITIIDIGCGSGILTAAALLLGASHALAMDIDPAAVAATRENAELNQVADRLEVSRGSVQHLLNNPAGFNPAPLVVANILSGILLKLFEDGLGNLVTDEGCLVLSGILAEQTSQILAASENAGFAFERELAQEDWRALVLRRVNRPLA